MAEIVISEFIDLDAVKVLQSQFDVFYDPELVDDPTRLNEETSRARALIVRNRKQPCASHRRTATRRIKP